MQNPITAVNYIENMRNKINSLDYFPYRGAIYSTKNNRFLIYQKHLIFYEIQEKDRKIIIEKIIHKNVNMEHFDVYFSWKGNKKWNYTK